MKEATLQNITEIAYDFGQFFIIIHTLNWTPKKSKGSPTRTDIIGLLKTGSETLKDLKMEGLSKGFKNWAEHFDKNYKEGQVFKNNDLQEFSADVNLWLGEFKTRLNNLDTEKTERKVERKLRELTKEIKTLEDKIDELQEEFTSWRAGVSR